MYRIANSGRPEPGRRLCAVVLAVLAVLTLQAVLSVTGAAAQDARDTGRSFTLRDGVVVDPGAGLLHVMSLDGGIDALSLGSGNVRWHSEDAARPISASAAGLLAQVEASEPSALVLAVLDGRGRLAQRGTVALPTGVEAPVTDGLSHRFVVRGDVTRRDGRFQVEWQSTFLAPRGALILDGEAAPRINTGALTFDPATGRSVEGQSTGLLAGPAIEPSETRRLAVPGRQYLSVDGKHVLASVGEHLEGESYEWTIYDASGTRLGSFTNRVEYAPFFVSEGLVVFEGRPGAWLEGEQVVEQPLSIQAISLSNGVEQWSVAIRETEYRGPFPP